MAFITTYAGNDTFQSEMCVKSNIAFNLKRKGGGGKAFQKFLTVSDAFMFHLLYSEQFQLGPRILMETTVYTSKGNLSFPPFASEM